MSRSRDHNTVHGAFRFPTNEFPLDAAGRVNPILNTIRSRVSRAQSLRLPLNRTRLLNGEQLQEGHVFNDVCLEPSITTPYGTQFHAGPLLKVISSSHAPGRLGVAAARNLKSGIIIGMAGVIHLKSTSLTDEENACTHQQGMATDGYKVTMLDHATSNICKYIQVTDNQDDANAFVIWQCMLPFLDIHVDLATGDEIILYRVQVVNEEHEAEANAKAEAVVARANAKVAAPAGSTSTTESCVQVKIEQGDTI